MANCMLRMGLATLIFISSTPYAALGGSQAAVSHSSLQERVRPLHHHHHAKNIGMLQQHENEFSKSRQRLRAQFSAQAKHMHMQMPMPTYIPQIGLANVTEPTMYPPPPPVMEPWKDVQPLDAAIGNYLTSRFIQPPTSTPIPKQSALNTAFGCPILVSYPDSVEIEVPTPCGSTDGGNMTQAGSTDATLTWSEQCSSFFNGLMPLVTYTMPTGDTFGSSQTAWALFGNSLNFYDCSGGLLFTADEKIYKQSDVSDPDLCEKYGSCDGIVYLQYFMYQGTEKVAETPYLKIFSDTITFLDPGGNAIATANRGEWNPTERSCSGDGEPETRKWTLKYESSAGGMWSDSTQRWPLAALVLMLSIRDQFRRPDGMVRASNCQVFKTGAAVLILIVGLVVISVGAALFIYFWLPRFKKIFENFELTWCPKRMHKPFRMEDST